MECPTGHDMDWFRAEVEVIMIPATAQNVGISISQFVYNNCYLHCHAWYLGAQSVSYS